MKQFCLWMLFLCAPTAMAQVANVDITEFERVSGLVEQPRETLRGGVAMDGWAVDSTDGEVAGQFRLRIPKGAKIRKAFLVSNLNAPFSANGYDQSLCIPEDAQVSVGEASHVRTLRFFEPGPDVEKSALAGAQRSLLPMTYWAELSEVIEPLAKTQMQNADYDGIVRIPVRERGDALLDFENDCSGQFLVVGHNLVVLWEHEAALLNTVIISKGFMMAEFKLHSIPRAPTTLGTAPEMCLEKPELRLPRVFSVSVMSGDQSESGYSVNFPELVLNEGLLLNGEDVSFTASIGREPTADNPLFPVVTTGSFGGAWNPPGPPAYGWPMALAEGGLSLTEPQAIEGDGLLNLSATKFGAWPRRDVDIRLIQRGDFDNSLLTLAVEQRPAWGKEKDADGDGLLDEADDACLDTDGNGIANRFDIDSDGDCLPDGEDPEPLVHDSQACGPGRRCQISYDKRMGECVGEGEGEEEGDTSALVRIKSLLGGGSGCGSPNSASAAFLVGGSGLFWALRRGRKRS